MAGQNPSPTTATPRGICTTCRTPATARALSALKLLTLPPKTGGRATSATSIPGSWTSSPKTALPLTFSASLPNDARRPEAAWTTKPGSVPHVAGSTFHCAAAAASSIARAAAPALRTRSHSVHVLVLPPVICIP